MTVTPNSDVMLNDASFWEHRSSSSISRLFSTLLIGHHIIM